VINDCDADGASIGAGLVVLARLRVSPCGVCGEVGCGPGVGHELVDG
jgi:hypothetical protein